jgi:hypothetical protein
MKREKSPLRFYVYAYIRSKTSDSGKEGTPYYIGKGTNKRAFSSHGSIRVPQKGFVVFIENNLSEIGAYALERRLISWWGRKIDGGCLLNKCIGGPGVEGVTITEESRNIRSRDYSGENHPMYGKRHSDKSKKIMRDAKTEAYLGENNPFFGKHHSEETRAILKANAKIRFENPENNPMYGKQHSQESRLKIQATKKNIRPVKCIDTGMEFPSLTYAEKYLKENVNPKASRSMLVRACNTGKIVYGCTWKFTKDIK